MAPYSKQQSTDHGGCSPFSVASDIQEGSGENLVGFSVFALARLAAILPLLPLNQY